MYDNSSVVGNIGETMALSEFARRGITVLIPFGKNVPYDLVIQIENKFFRIQCKTTQRPYKEGQMRFNICRTNGFTGEHKRYADNEIDYFCLYCIENDYIALVPMEEISSSREFVIRTEKPKNNQLKGIHMADDYSIDNQLRTISSAVRSTVS